MTSDDGGRKESLSSVFKYLSVMKKFIPVLYFILFLVLFIPGCGNESTPPSDPKAPPDYEGTIVAVGDSLTEGLGVAEELAYPALLEKKLRYKG